jgi:hypothetical protein
MATLRLIYKVCHGNSHYCDSGCTCLNLLVAQNVFSSFVVLPQSTITVSRGPFYSVFK